MKKVIFLQSKLPTDERSLVPIVLRWKSYGELLRERDTPADIWIFTPKPLPVKAQNLMKISCLQFFPSVEKSASFIKRLRELRRELSDSKEKVTLVCGDIQQSFLIALILKLVCGNFLHIQIQFHGDTYTYRSATGIKGFTRVCLSRLGIRRADSIRIVSKFQVDEIVRISPSARVKLVIAPIPVDFSRVARVSAAIRFDIAFIGRLHSERGILELIEIVRILLTEKSGIRVVIVGDGPLRKKIESDLAPWINNSTISILGLLSGAEIQNIYASTKVLISTAPKEGYGLTLREAALSNLFVIARKSKGVVEAQESFPAGIETYSNVQEAVMSIRQRLDESRRPMDAKIEAIQVKTDAKGIDRLLDSWLGG